MMEDTTCLHANKNSLIKRKKSMFTEETWENPRAKFLNRREGWHPEPKWRGWPWMEAETIDSWKQMHRCKEYGSSFFKSLKATIEGIGQWFSTTHYKVNYLVSTRSQFLYLLNALSGYPFVQETL